MQEHDFHEWLLQKYGRQTGTADSRLKNCLRVEQFEGDLDRHFEKDQCRGLLNRLTYSAGDEENKRQPRHRIPINGKIRNGTSTLKNAVNLYVEFKRTGITAGASTGHGTPQTGILRVVFNQWLRNPKTGKTPYKIIADDTPDSTIPGTFETLFAYQFVDYAQCERARQTIHQLLEKYQEAGEWFSIGDNELALIKLNCEGALGGTRIGGENL